jgi:chromosome segregation ATPase
MRAAVLLAAATILAGCCSNVSTDPRQGGYVGGVCGKATGAYEGRLVARRAELASLDAASAALQARLGSEQREVSSLEQRLAASRRKLADNRRQIDLLAAMIDQQAAAGRIDQQRLAALKAELADLDRQMVGLVARTAETEKVARALREGVAVAQTARQIDAAAAEVTREGAAVSDRLQAFQQKLGRGK